MITVYDPNIRWARHTVSMTFMQWDYSLTVDVDVMGNCHGVSVFDGALWTAFDDLRDDEEDNAVIILKRPSEDVGEEDTLEVTIEDDEDLKALCVGISIKVHVAETRE